MKIHLKPWRVENKIKYNQISTYLKKSPQSETSKIQKRGGGRWELRTLERNRRKRKSSRKWRLKYKVTKGEEN